MIILQIVAALILFSLIPVLLPIALVLLAASVVIALVLSALSLLVISLISLHGITGGVTTYIIVGLFVIMGIVLGSEETKEVL